MNKYTVNMRVRGSGLVIQDDSLLLVEFYSEPEGLHYVLPGGGVRPGETIREAVAREVLEESCVKVEVGRLAIVYEFTPNRDPRQHEGLSLTPERPPAVSLVFACRAVGGRARLPDRPDQNQTAARWIPLDELDTIKLSPPIQRQILQYAYQPGMLPIEFVEEWKL